MMENCEKTIILENLFLEKDKKKGKEKSLPRAGLEPAILALPSHYLDPYANEPLVEKLSQLYIYKLGAKCFSPILSPLGRFRLPTF